MKEYLRILKNVLENGVPKQPVRFDSAGNAMPIENGTIGTFCEVFRHNMADGFPLLTTRKLPFRSTLIELEGFIKGITSKKWFIERGCNYWKWWASPPKVKDLLVERPELSQKQAQEIEDDLGPLGYSWGWRKFGQQYGNPEDLGQNGVEDGYDQLKTIADRLKQNPYDRRMVCSAWNPNQLDLCALPSCHYNWNVVVYGNKLNLVWNQRSADIICGIPQNISSYATLLLLLSKHANLEPGELVGTLHDCHLYNNLIEQTKVQLLREPKSLPTLEIPNNGDSFDLFKWDHTQVILKDYNPHPPIKMEVTV